MKTTASATKCNWEQAQALREATGSRRRHIRCGKWAEIGVAKRTAGYRTKGGGDGRLQGSDNHLRRRDRLVDPYKGPALRRTFKIARTELKFI